MKLGLFATETDAAIVLWGECFWVRPQIEKSVYERGGGVLNKNSKIRTLSSSRSPALASLYKYATHTLDRSSGDDVLYTLSISKRDHSPSGEVILKKKNISIFESSLGDVSDI